MQCPRCQQENPSDHKFCSECGTSLQSAGSVQQTPSYADVQHSLTEALEQQTATAEILRVIASNPTDIDPVLRAVVESASRLCRAHDVSIRRLEGDGLRLVAHQGPILHPGAVVPVVRGNVAGRTVLDRRTIHVVDMEVERDEFPDAFGPEFGRTILSVPLLREGAPIGVILLRRAEVSPFSNKQTELLQTFADQAVIAIENVRLFKELEARNSQLNEALDQQTATSEILRTIAHTQTDVQPVFDTIVRSAAQLFHTANAAVFVTDGRMVYHPANYGSSPESLAVIRAQFPRPLDMSSAPGMVILTQSVVHVPDSEEPTVVELVRQAGRLLGFRSLVSVPMRREGAAVGAISVTRQEPGRFSSAEVELLKTFADQAVIAIENVRLFTELQEKNRAVTKAHAQVSEALDQQTATAEILRVISSSPTDVQPVFDTIAERALRLCDAKLCTVFRFDGKLIHLVALDQVSMGGAAAYRDAYPAPPGRGGGTHRAILTGSIVHIPDIRDDPEYELHDLARANDFGCVLSVPMLRDRHPIGAITVGREAARPFADEQIELLKTFADQALIAIENVKLFKELEARNKDLTEALDQQTATSDILRVISQSPTDVQPVFDAIVQSAVRLLRAYSGVLTRIEGDQIVFAALTSTDETGDAALRATFPQSVRTSSTHGRVIRDRTPFSIADAHTDPRIPEAVHAYARVRGYRSQVLVPLLRHDEPVGTISITRREAGGFTDDEIALLKTFADQAVIAIENVRLFNETKEALEQQTATAEILRVISESPTDIRPVFAAVLDRALALCEASNGSIYQLEDGTLRHVGLRGPHLGIAVGDVVPLESSPGRAILEKRTVHLEDVLQELDWHAPEVREGVRRAGLRTTVSVPLLREQTAIGAIVVRRLEVRPFSGKQIRLLQTFADQAVIAIENVRLFKELEASNKDLREALDTQTATSDILSVISRSQTDVQPVFDAILASAVRLLGANSGGLTRVAGDKIILAAITSTDPAGDAAAKAAFPLPLHSEGVHAPAIRSRAPVNSAHAQTDQRLPEVTRELARVRGEQSLVTVPLLRDEEPLGAITVTRREAGGFTDDEITLLQTFASQAVIAIENVRLFKELQGANRELSAASQHKSEFLANMSHELRTPLNAIIGFSEVLSEKMFGELNEKQEEYSKDIHASGQHLLSLINDILDLSKIEAGRMELELTDFDLPTALDNALMLVRERAQRRSLTLDKEVDNGVGEIQGDERKIRQVVLNLLSNAIKFTPAGGRIKLAAVSKDDCVEVSVSDTGVGIAPEDQEKVFEEFRQVGTADKKAEGTGLGLTLCRKFIELHGGKIWVKSQLGAGSTFTFTIPVHRGE